MKIELTQEEKRSIASFALAGVLMTGIPTLANADTTVKSPLVGEVIEEVDYREYVVQDGDTLGGIAERLFGNAGYWEQIAEYNKLANPNKLSIGDVIRIPNRLNPINCNAIITPNNELIYVEPTVYAEDETYVVEPGDIMSCIIKKFYGRIDLITVDKLATYNNLADPNRISVGQVLLIPCIEKLDSIVPNDYSQEYAEMQWRLDHPNCPREYSPCEGQVIWVFPENPCDYDHHHDGPCHHHRLVRKP